MPLVYLGLGSNVNDRASAITSALERLPIYGLRVVTTASLYETEPWGVTDQDTFLNSACIIATSLPPLLVLQAVKAIERALGRTPTKRWGPRVIDIDILVYERVTMTTPELTLPHPGLADRAHVLVPLAEIAPDLKHPLTRRTIHDHLKALGPIDGVAAYPPGLDASDAP